MDGAFKHRKSLYFIRLMLDMSSNKSPSLFSSIAKLYTFLVKCLDILISEYI